MTTFCPVENMDYLEVNHIDGDRNNNYLSNLEWVTPSENVRHAFKIGLREPMSGERNGMSRIDVETVIKICDDIMLNCYTENELSEKYNISTSLIHGIKHKTHWKHITQNYDFPKQIQGNTKLTEDEVRQICADINKKIYSLSDLSDKYNVTVSCVKDIKYKRTWRYITREYF